MAKEEPMTLQELKEKGKECTTQEVQETYNKYYIDLCESSHGLSFKELVDRANSPKRYRRRRRR